MHSETAKMSTLVTGGTGFIGANLVRFLCAQGHDVRVLCRLTSDTTIFANNSVNIYRGDVLDFPSVERAVEGCDYVFHLAGYAKNWAKRPEIFLDVNVTGTTNILEASTIANVKKVVFTSSSMTLGPSAGIPVAESHARAADFFCDYERTKFYAEEAVGEYVQKGVPVVVVNPTRLFGPGLLTEGNFVTNMIRSYVRGRWRVILSDGSMIGNYAFVEDVVRGHWLALQHGRPGEKYVLGGENLSLKEFFSILADVSEKHYGMIHAPGWIMRVSAELQLLMAKWFGIHPLFTPDWVRVMLQDWAFSSEKAERELGLKMTPFREGLRQTLEWLNRDIQNVGDVH